MRNKNKKYIIGGLIGLCVMMTIAYGAFLTNLNINGTTSITSNWNVLITNIESKTIVGNASNEKEPTHDKLSATFSTKLESPGDSIEYEITVENQGNIDAVLKKVTLSDSNNPAIKFTTSGLLEGELLNKGKSKTFIVKVEYLSDVTMQPENSTANLTVTLEYTQKNVNDEGISTPEKEEIDMKGVTVPLVTENDGLYEDEYEIGRYVYKGANSNNYITFNGEEAGWRIIAIEADGTIKIVKIESIGKMAFDSPGLRTTGYCSHDDAPIHGCGIWAKTDNYVSGDGTFSGVVEKDSELKTYLNSTYYQSINPISQNYIQEHDFYYGCSLSLNDTPSDVINAEKKYMAKSMIGLITWSDYGRSFADSECTFDVVHDNGKRECISKTYIVQGTTDTWQTWILRPWGGSAAGGDSITWNGLVGGGYADSKFQVRPAIYLKSDITLSGKGTKEEPFTIN